MGMPDDEWYVDGPAELTKERPLMPENLNPALEGVVLPSDYGTLSGDRDKAWEALSAIAPGSYGYAEKGMVEKLLNARTEAVTPADMTRFRKVRSIQVDGGMGIFSYPYFNCRFTVEPDGRVFFAKSTGSQRKSGYVYQNGPDSLVFLGGWSVNNDPTTDYGSENSVAGPVYRIGPRRAIMIFPTGNNRVEIYELTE